MSRYIDDERTFLDMMRVFHGEKPIQPMAVLAERVFGKDSFQALYFSERNEIFEKLCRNRLIMGAMRYGRLGSPGKAKYDRIASILKRIGLYASTGNQEHLVDVANECLIEFTEPSRPGGAHWESQADGYHTPKMAKGEAGDVQLEIPVPRQPGQDYSGGCCQEQKPCDDCGLCGHQE